MTDRPPLGGLGRRLLGSLLVVSLSAVAVIAVGTVVPHLMARTGHLEAVDTPWLLAATVLAASTAVLASVVAAHRMVGPMHTMLAAARGFAAGDHTIRLPALGRPELEELVEALNAAAEEVERSERSRQRLTADIAHELRTPLTALQAGLEELCDGLVPPDPRRLDALHTQAVRLGRIVADLADLSTAEGEGLRLTRGPVDLGEVARLSLDAHTTAMTAAGIEVRRDLAAGVIVDGDSDRLHQVMGNLLANTAAYCRPGDTVEVSARTESGTGVLEVADSGPGMDQAERSRAFDRRWRGEAAQAAPGSGLGLPIVRALVLAHGGQVRIRPATPSGIVVRVELPLWMGVASNGVPASTGRR